MLRLPFLSPMPIDSSKKCIGCGVTDGPEGNNGSFRCQECNRLKSRLISVFANMPADTKSSFLGMDKKQKQQFYADHHTAFGDDLSMAVQESVSQVEAEVSKVLQSGTGNFIDEENLKEKYAKKPLQLAAIMKNTKRFRDRVRECTLFEDVKFTTVVSNEQRVETEKKRTMTQDREKKRAKKAKSEEGGKAAKVEPGEPKPFTESQTKAVAKFIESTGSYYIKLGEAITVVEAEGLGDFMNAKFMTSVQGCHCKIKEALAEFTVAKDNNAGSLPALKALHTAIKEQSAQSIRRLTLQTDEAKALKAEEEE
jgi:hypothetical protein